VSRTTRTLQVAGALGVAVAVAVLPTPPGLTSAGQYALATTAFAAVLWVGGGLPLSVTALLVPVLLTIFGVYPRFEGALSGFADPVLFLFLGTFVLAGALQSHGLDRRMALALVAAVGTGPRRTLLGVMVTSAALSMVISNTATAAMMIPVALGLAGAPAGDLPAAGDAADTPAGTDDRRDASPTDPADEPTPERAYQTALVLGVAYAASVGGVGTLVGSPTNAIAVAQIDAALGVRITFVDWLTVGLPTVVLTLPIVWLLLCRLFPAEAVDEVGPGAGIAPGTETETDAAALARGVSDGGPRGLADLDPGARRVALVFAAVAALWILGGIGALFRDRLPAAVAATLFGGPGPSVFGAGDHQGVLYFALVGVLAVPALVLWCDVDADDLAGIDWNTLVLFGGGISLADALLDTGATRWLADAIFGAVLGVPLVALLGVIVLLSVALSELASNTATVAILAPVLIEVGVANGALYGLAPVDAGVTLAMATAIAASYGFALPVATPPNAIAFGTGAVSRREMLRAGLATDLLLAAATTAVLFALATLGVLGG